jgi:hypothetical protein
LGISIREFARREACSDTLVRKALKAGKIAALPDGSLDPTLVGTGWRLGNRRDANSANGTVRKPDETPEEAAERIVLAEGHAPYSLAEAERIKENFLAKLKELEFDLKSGEVVRVADVMKVVATQYAIVRNRMLSIPAEVAPRAAMLTSPQEVQAFVQAEIVEALEALALDLATSADGLRRALH